VPARRRGGRPRCSQIAFGFTLLWVVWHLVVSMGGIWSVLPKAVEFVELDMGSAADTVGMGPKARARAAEHQARVNAMINEANAKVRVQVRMARDAQETAAKDAANPEKIFKAKILASEKGFHGNAMITELEQHLVNMENMAAEARAKANGADAPTTTAGAAPFEEEAVETGAVKTGAVKTGAVETGAVETGAVETGAVFEEAAVPKPTQKPAPITAELESFLGDLEIEELGA
jgi:hypothetical protein